MSEDLRFKSAIDEMTRRREESGIDMNGKKYSMVKDRIEVFRRQFGGEYGIDTHIVPNPMPAVPTSIVVVRASIVHIATGNIAGSGHAMAFYGSDVVNTTSIVEAVETSAIGRALASFGLHGGEYASDREMEAIPAKKAATEHRDNVSPIRQQKASAPSHPSVNQYNFFQPGSAKKEDMDKLYEAIDKISDPHELTAYYNFLSPLIPHFPFPEQDEIRASFKSRNNQLKGL